MSEAPSAAPTWFHDALDQKYDERFIDVGGTPIHYLAWGQHGNPGIVFVHGGAAHAHSVNRTTNISFIMLTTSTTPIIFITFITLLIPNGYVCF